MCLEKIHCISVIRISFIFFSSLFLLTMSAALLTLTLTYGEGYDTALKSHKQLKLLEVAVLCVLLCFSH